MKKEFFEPKIIGGSWYLRIPKHVIDTMDFDKKKFEITVKQDGIMYTTTKLPFTGVFFHMTNAMNSPRVDERKRSVALARCYEMTENEKKALDIIEREDFCFTHFLKEMGPDWAKYYADMAQKALAYKFTSGMREYHKNR